MRPFMRFLAILGRQESDKATVRVNRMGRPDSDIY